MPCCGDKPRFPMVAPGERRLLTAPAAAAQLGMSIRHFRRLAEAHGIAPIELGIRKRRLWTPAQIAALRDVPKPVSELQKRPRMHVGSDAEMEAASRD